MSQQQRKGKASMLQQQRGGEVAACSGSAKARHRRAASRWRCRWRCRCELAGQVS